jgi:hypothetical protein
VGCTIVTIERPSPDRLSAGPLYMCPPRCIEAISHSGTLYQNRRVLVSAEVLANHKELIYEVTWIPELGAWRRFLRSRRKVHR